MTVPNVTYSRCQRVQSALEKNAGIAKMLGPKEHVVHRPPPSNQPVKFSEVVIAITHAIAEAGEEPSSLGQRGIIHFAMPILADYRDGKPLPKFDPVAAPPEPAPARPKPTPKPKAKVKAKPQEPLKRRPVVKPTATPASNGPLIKPEEPQPDPERPEKHVAKQFVLGETSKQPQRETAPPAAEPLPQPVLDEARTAPVGTLPYVWGVTVNTLYCGVIQLLEQAGMRDSSLYKRTVELSNEVAKVTVIPRNAKESQSSPGRVSAS